MPAAIRAMISAVAGAMMIKSAHLANSMCPIASSACVSSKLSATAFPDIACRVSGVINALAPSVITTRISAPCSFNLRTNSGVL